MRSPLLSRVTHVRYSVLVLFSATPAETPLWYASLASSGREVETVSSMTTWHSSCPGLPTAPGGLTNSSGSAVTCGATMAEVPRASATALAAIFFAFIGFSSITNKKVSPNMSEIQRFRNIFSYNGQVMLHESSYC